MTSIPELSREQRNAAKVERYSDGEAPDAIDAIGQSCRLTCERVRQIIAHGGRERPSVASVRGIYGTWSDAVRFVQE